MIRMSLTLSVSSRLTASALLIGPMQRTWSSSMMTSSGCGNWRGGGSPLRLASAISVRQCCVYPARLRWHARVMEKLGQRTKQGQINPRSSCNAPARADYPVEHPRRDLKPTNRRLPRKAAAENLRVALLDHLMDMDLPPGPGMPRIKKLALNAGPVGVPSSRCTMRSDPTAPSATSRRLCC